MSNELEVDPKEIVMGLHWQPRPPSASRMQRAVNLDAQCVLFDGEGHVVELIGPGRLSNANGSVLHTGDSRTGAGEWDQERIFVFLDALPESVSALAFLVSSVDEHAFSEVPGATCHVSDRLTEREWIRLDLTALGNRKEQSVAILRRGPAGWQISPCAQAMRAPQERLHVRQNGSPPAGRGVRASRAKIGA